MCEFVIGRLALHNVVCVVLATNSGLGSLSSGLGKKISGEKFAILISFLFTKILFNWDAYHSGAISEWSWPHFVVLEVLYVVLEM